MICPDCGGKKYRRRNHLRRRNPGPRYRRNGDLYKHYVTAGGYMGDQPIDNLIHAVQSSFIDWDLQNPKFIKLFKLHFPRGEDRLPAAFLDAWIEEMGGIQNILLDLLNEDTSRQSKSLLKVLIRKTKETGGTAESGILNIELDKWMDLSVRAQRVVVEGLGIDTVEKLINTPKHELVKSRNIGRTTCRELSFQLTKLLEQWDFVSSSILEGRPLQRLLDHDVVKGKATQEEINRIQEWIDSGVVKYRRNPGGKESRRRRARECPDCGTERSLFKSKTHPKGWYGYHGYCISCHFRRAGAGNCPKCPPSDASYRSC